MTHVSTSTARAGAAVTSLIAAANWTNRLLSCGIAAGPLFVGVALVQAFTREGFDFRRHPISMLSLGDLGWIQVANFITAGLLTVLFAIGIWRALHHGRAGTWGPVLVGMFGVGTLAAGLFSADPAMGFPPGAPAGVSETLSWHSMLHGLSFFVAFASLVAACFVFARRFAGLKRSSWTWYCVLTGVVAPAVVVVGIGDPTEAGVPFLLAATLAFAWLAALAIDLLTQSTFVRVDVTRTVSPPARAAGRSA